MHYNQILKDLRSSVVQNISVKQEKIAGILLLKIFLCLVNTWTMKQ